MKSSRKAVWREIAEDGWQRLRLYRSDWADGWEASVNLLAPAIFIAAISLMKGMAFGQQINEFTDGKFTTVHILASTAVANAIQVFLGGQPLVVLQIPAPHVIVLGMLFSFLADSGKKGKFNATASLATIFAGVMIVSFSIAGLPRSKKYITRAIYETFGLLISAFLMQQAIIGALSHTLFLPPSYHFSKVKHQCRTK